MAQITIKDISKSYGSVNVLKDIGLEIEDQEFVALIGPSGCGKSTLLRIIAGLEEASGGNIEIDGTVVNEFAPKERDIAMVFQSYALYPHMNVYKNMAFTLKMRGDSKADIDTKVRQAAATLNLTDFLDRSPAQLSGGQRQRVAMGRALVRNPKVFLFDEPLSNLDAKLRAEMRTEIRRLHQDLKATSIYVTHDQVEAMTMADRIVVLNGGDIVQQGAPMELFDHPATAFVARFIGSPQMNIYDGDLTPENGGSRIVSKGGQDLYLPGIAVAARGKIQWGLRADDLTLADPGDGQISGRVAIVEHTGSETLIFVDTPLGEVCVKAPPRAVLKPGDKTGISFDVEKLHLFDAVTGLRIKGNAARKAVA